MSPLSREPRSFSRPSPRLAAGCIWHWPARSCLCWLRASSLSGGVLAVMQSAPWRRPCRPRCRLRHRRPPARPWPLCHLPPRRLVPGSAADPAIPERGLHEEIRGRPALRCPRPLRVLHRRFSPKRRPCNPARYRLLLLPNSQPRQTGAFPRRPARRSCRPHRCGPCSQKPNRPNRHALSLHPNGISSLTRTFCLGRNPCAPHLLP